MPSRAKIPDPSHSPMPDFQEPLPWHEVPQVSPFSTSSLGPASHELWAPQSRSVKEPLLPSLLTTC